MVGHAVRALYLLAGVVDVYLETGEEALLDSALRQWSSMSATKLYLTGAIGSRFEGESFGDEYELPPDLVYGETCATIATMMVAWRLLLATGEGRFADAFERALFNLVVGVHVGAPQRVLLQQPGAAPGRRTPPRLRTGDSSAPRRPARGRRGSSAPAARPTSCVRSPRSAATSPRTPTHGIQVHQYIPSDIAGRVRWRDGAPAVGHRVPDRRSGDAHRRRRPEPTRGRSAFAFRAGVAMPRSRSTACRSTRPPIELGYLRINRPWRAGDVVGVHDGACRRG